MNTFKIVTAAIVGHVLEFFDFTVYAVFSVKIGELFFPHHSPFVQLLSSLAVFAVGFFMRPIGGIVFGHIGDKYGRRSALTLSVLIMAGATFSIGLMPDYNSVGVYAPILLIICRLIQGLCVGGEGAGASIFVLEHLHGIKPGLVGGIVNSALTLGILFAIATGILLNQIFGIDSSAWRYAFMLGGVLGLVGLYIRLSVDETPIFEKLRAEGKIIEFPIATVFRTNLKNVIVTIAVGGLTGATGYAIMTFLNVFFQKVMHYEANTALFYGALGNLLLVIFLPFMGWISDKFGYGKTIAWSCIAIMLFSIPIYQLIASGSEFFTILGILFLSILVAANYAPLYPFMLNLFPAEQRYSGIACSLNIGIALFGGTSSMFCIYLIEKTGILFSGAFYLDFVCIMFLTTIFFIRRDKFYKYFFPNKFKVAEQTI